MNSAVRLVVITLGLVVCAEFLVRVMFPPQTLWLDLDFPPKEGEVLIIGNSMFKTGVDLKLFEDVSGEPAEFNYFDGEYTNLWYLIFKNAIVPADVQPSLLIWGFRPRYASTPAFRKRKAGPIEHFRLDHEGEYDAIASAVELSWREQINIILSNSRMFSLRPSLQDAVLQASKSWMALVVSGLSSSLPADWKDEVRRRSVSDLLLEAVTNNAVHMSEELVADVAGPGDRRFVIGDRVLFGSSFVPKIAQRLMNNGVPQMVVIFKPVTEVQDRTPRELVDFKNDALAFFRRNNIPVANVFDEVDLDSNHFGKGDHYNEGGRAKVTEFVARNAARALADQR